MVSHWCYMLNEGRQNGKEEDRNGYPSRSITENNTARVLDMVHLKDVESAFGRKPVYTADIVMIAFFPYDDRESVKRHRAFPIMVHGSSTYSRLNCEKLIPQSNWRWCSTNTFL
ncbi:hypothetical protein TNCV_3585681 [Trichonephila clavipes]|nr:hypothetical protein TNCV_3585681 [Trichonephila clavipes]